MTVDEKGLEAVAQAIWNLRREEEDRCDMELADMGKSHPVWDEARAAITAYEAAKTAEGAVELDNMSCAEQLATAIRLAENIGYMVVPDPVHADGEVHAPEFVMAVQPSLRALGFHAVPLEAAPPPPQVTHE